MHTTNTHRTLLALAIAPFLLPSSGMAVTNTAANGGPKSVVYCKPTIDYTGNVNGNELGTCQVAMHCQVGDRTALMKTYYEDLEPHVLTYDLFIFAQYGPPGLIDQACKDALRKCEIDAAQYNEYYTPPCIID